jgi:AraC-like DNA-binding protein
LPLRRQFQSRQSIDILRQTQCAALAPYTMRRSIDQIKVPPYYCRLSLCRFGANPSLRDAILEGTGVSESALRQGLQFLTLRQQLRQQENMRRLFGPGWAVSAPELWGHVTYGLLSMASQSAPTLRDALSTICEHGDACGALWTFTIEVPGDEAVFDFALNVDIEERFWSTALEIGFIGLKSLLALYLGAEPTGCRYLFSSARPEHADTLQEVLGGQIEFGAARSGVVFPSAWLGTVSPLQDTALHDLARRGLESQIDALGRSRSVGVRVATALRDKPTARAALPEIARELGLSTRTLVRRLGDEGTSFRCLVEAEQKRRMERMRTSGRTSTAELSASLGFSDPASFVRARRRWGAH